MMRIVNISDGRSHIEHDPDCGFHWGYNCDCYPHAESMVWPFVCGIAFWAVLVGLSYQYACKPKPVVEHTSMYLTDQVIAPAPKVDLWALIEQANPKAEKLREQMQEDRKYDRQVCDSFIMGQGGVPMSMYTRLTARCARGI